MPTPHHAGRGQGAGSSAYHHQLPYFGKPSVFLSLVIFVSKKPIDATVRPVYIAEWNGDQLTVTKDTLR